MKIAFVAQDLVGQGVQYATAAMARAFFERGYAVDVLLSQVHFDYIAEGRKPFEVPSGVRIVRMPNRRSSRNIFFLRRYLRAGGAEYVIAASGLYSMALRLAALGKWRHPKLVQVWHGDTPASGLPFGARIKRWIKYTFLYSKYFRLLTVNESIREGVLRMTNALRPNEICTVHNPVIDAVFYEKKQLPPRHPWLVSKTCPTFIAAGAYDKNKNHMLLLEAVKIVSRKHRLRLIVFGKGQEETALREFVTINGLEDTISIAGFTDNLPAEMNAADGFLMSSNVESFGIVIAEALACGVPVISTDAPNGPREVLEYGKYGKLVPVNDPQAMAEAITSEIEHPSMPVDDEAWQRFTVERITDRYLRGLGIVNG